MKITDIGEFVQMLRTEMRIKGDGVLPSEFDFAYSTQKQMVGKEENQGTALDRLLPGRRGQANPAGVPQRYESECEGVLSMHPFNKPIGDLRLSDIQTLISNEIPEGRTLDYKRDLYGTNDDEKMKFLCDVSAFANTVGGYLIIGMHEEDKIAKELTPISIDDFDTLEGRFQNWLRMSVDPPIRGVEFEPIDVGGGQYVLVVEIPTSISRPHAVRHRNYWLFHGRHSTGNYPYEIDDLRRAILQSETLAVRMRNFRNDRLSQISVGETPVPLHEGAKTILHVIPASAFELGQRHDLGTISNADLPTLCDTCPSSRRNFDGYVTHMVSSDTGLSFNYAQLFHSGIIEAADVLLLEKRGEVKIIPSKGFEEHLVGAMNKYLGVLDRLDVEFPMWVCLSLLGVKSYVMSQNRALWSHVTHPIDRAELILPEIQVEDASIPVERVLKPAFDFIWNACGYKRSMNYDDNGNWLLRAQ